MDILAGEVDRLVSASLSENTLNSYKLALRMFMEFRENFSLPPAWPPQLSDIVNFLAYLSSSGYAFKTVNTYIFGLSFFLKLYGWPELTNSFIIKKMLSGLQRSRPSKDIRAPITLEILTKLPFALTNIASSHYEASLFSTAFSVAFFGFMRIGEIAAKCKKDCTSRLVQFSDLSIADNECKLNIRFSKTDQCGKSITLVFVECQTKSICPVRLLQKFCKERPVSAGPLFCHFDGSPITKYQVSAMLRKALHFLNIDSSRFRNHSFRIGAATTYSAQNVPENIIQTAGRWSKNSSTYKQYIRLDKILA